jgi:hypothetical protein
MKKIIASILLVVVAFAMPSCTEEISRNSPALEGMKDNVRWRARASEATLADNGSVTFVGLTQFETLTMTVPSAAPGTYAFGTSDIYKVSYVYERDGQQLFYTTGNGVGDGQLIIDEFDTEKMTISGSFRFNAINVNENPLGGPILNFQYGKFYKVPVIPAL